METPLVPSPQNNKTSYGKYILVGLVLGACAFFAGVNYSKFGTYSEELSVSEGGAIQDTYDQLGPTNNAIQDLREGNQDLSSHNDMALKKAEGRENYYKIMKLKEAAPQKVQDGFMMCESACNTEAANKLNYIDNVDTRYHQCWALSDAQKTEFQLEFEGTNDLKFLDDVPNCVKGETEIVLHSTMKTVPGQKVPEPEVTHERRKFSDDPCRCWKYDTIMNCQTFCSALGMKMHLTRGRREGTCLVPSEYMKLKNVKMIDTKAESLTNWRYQKVKGNKKTDQKPMPGFRLGGKGTATNLPGDAFYCSTKVCCA